MDPKRKPVVRILKVGHTLWSTSITLQRKANMVNFVERRYIQDSMV